MCGACFFLVSLVSVSLPLSPSPRLFLQTFRQAPLLPRKRLQDWPAPTARLCYERDPPSSSPPSLSPNRKSWIPGRSFRAFAQEEFTTCRALPEMCLRRPASLDESVAGASQPVQKPMKSSVFKPLDGGGGARVSQKGLVLYRVVPCCLLCVLFPLSSYFFFLRTQCRIPRLPTAMAAPRAQTRRGERRLARNNQRWRGITSAGAE